MRKGYVVIATRKNQDMQYKKCLALSMSLKGEPYWSDNEVVVFDVGMTSVLHDEVFENLFKPYKTIETYTRKFHSCWEMQRLKPWADGRGYISTSLKNNMALIYSKSPNELAYRLAKNTMLCYLNKISRIYECRVYRIGRSDLPIKIVMDERYNLLKFKMNEHVPDVLNFTFENDQVKPSFRYVGLTNSEKASSKLVDDKVHAWS